MATRIGVREAEGPRIIVDCTHTFHTGAYTGIQRVVRNLADALLANDDRVVPVRVQDGRFVPLELAGNRVAFPTAGRAREEETSGVSPAWRRLALLRRWGHAANRVLRSARLAEWLDAGPNADGLARKLSSLSIRRPEPHPQAIEIASADIVVSLDSSWVYDIRTPLEAARRAGATCIALLCDVLPVSHPEWFTEGTRRYFRGWLEMLLPRVNAIVAISTATCRDLAQLIAQNALAAPAVPCHATRLGAEIAPAGSGEVRDTLRGALASERPPAFLTVGTLEPRKNVDYAIALFDELRGSGLDCQWHIVGSPGWLAHATIDRIRAHPEYGRRLFWWTDLADAELDFAYRHAAALVAVSRAEGFGLPIVEARLHDLPAFASDIPVFREVLGAEGRYLPLDSPRLAAAVLEDFLTRPELRRASVPTSAIARPWSEAAAQLLRTLLDIDRSSRAAPR